MMTTDLPFTNEPPACIQDAGSWCRTVFNITHNEWLAASADWLIAKPLRILLILLIALLVRYLAKRIIDRLTRATEGKTPTLLRPLKERAPQALGALVSERRAQRAR